MEGGGIACDNGADVVITDCIITGNRSVDGAGIMCHGSSPLIENSVIAFGFDGNIAADPRFCAPGSFDYSLAADSPCLPANNECLVLMGALGQGCSVPTFVADGANDGPPSAPRMFPNMPNPFNPQTTITFSLERDAWGEVGVYELTGRRVSVLAEQTYTAGTHRLAWNGRDSRGRAVPSGTYVIRVETDSGVAVRKISLVR